jgi:hypothetical protein
MMHLTAPLAIPYSAIGVAERMVIGHGLDK